MKKILFGLMFCGALFSSTFAQTTAYELWFTWTQNPAYELVSGYRIEYMKSPSTNWSYLTFVSGTTNVAVAKGVQGGFQYKFRVFAVNAIGTGTNLSSIIAVPTNAPSAVTNYQLTAPR